MVLGLGRVRLAWFYLPLCRIKTLYFSLSGVELWWVFAVPQSDLIMLQLDRAMADCQPAPLPFELVILFFFIKQVVGLLWLIFSRPFQPAVACKMSFCLHWAMVGSTCQNGAHSFVRALELSAQHSTSPSE